MSDSILQMHGFGEMTQGEMLKAIAELYPRHALDVIAALISHAADDPQPATQITTDDALTISARNKPAFERGQSLQARIETLLERHYANEGRHAKPLTSKQIGDQLGGVVSGRQIRRHLEVIRGQRADTSSH